MNHIIYHITTLSEWQQAQKTGFYEAASLPIEGFIHCSTENQVDGVLNRYFKVSSNGRDLERAGTLVKLTIDSDKLHSRLQHDFSASLNEYFPHIYGRLNLDAVIEVTPLP